MEHLVRQMASVGVDSNLGLLILFHFNYSIFVTLVTILPFFLYLLQDFTSPPGIWGHFNNPFKGESLGKKTLFQLILLKQIIPFN